jgi:hypothetical protein
MHVAGSVERLRALLVEEGVPLGRGKQPAAASVADAWTAFQRYAALPVVESDLGEGPNDDLLYEAGVFDWGAFELSLVRQFGTADGDIQQVSLVAHFAPADATGGAGPRWSSSEDRERWFADVESSDAFRGVVDGRLRPLGYEVRQESAE